MPKQRDIFICHAGEDKPSVVRPLVRAFDAANISHWFDEAEIKWGDSITEKVNEGLKISRYVIVLLSEAFIKKNWPQRELNSALNIEASSGQVRVLPLIAGTEETKKRIIGEYPILNDKFYLSWNDDTSSIVEALQARLEKTDELASQKQASIQNPTFEAPLPEIKKKFTQRDKDIFLKDSFKKIKSYFQHALSRLEEKYPDIETDFTEIHNFKFTCTIYLNGDVKTKCKIWMGGPLSSDSISYYEGDFNLDQDGSCNDWITVNDEGAALGLKPSGFGLVSPDIEKDKALSPEKAAEYLWLRFTERLKY